MNRCFFLMLFLPSFIVAQKIDHMVSFRDLNSASYFRINYDNDFFSATDKDYTQGYNLELVAPFLKKSPLNFLPFAPKGTVSKYGLSIEHIGFTPQQYQLPDIQFGDRPFAAAIMLKSFRVATDTVKKSRITSSLSIGLIGPGAFGREMQAGIHRWTGNKVPLGWRNQIKNDVVLNFRLAYEKRLWSYTDLMALNAAASAQLGTLFNHVSAGINTAIGLVNRPYTKDKKGFRLYLYTQPTVKLIGYDATLQGGLFNRDSPYTISVNTVKRLTGQFDYGLVIQIRTLYFEYTRSLITREFDSGQASAWGGINVGFSF